MKHIYNILYCLLIIAGFMSCVTEDIASNCPDNSGTGKPGNAQVMLNLSVPNNRLPSATRAVADESGIEVLNMLVFESDIFQKVVDITGKYESAATDENSRVIYVPIEETENPVRLLLIANADISRLTAGSSTLSDAKQLIFSGSNRMTSIPMYGETAEFSDGLSRDRTYDVSVELIRSFAKIEVQYNSSQLKSEFEFLGVEAVNVNTGGYVANRQEILAGQTVETLSVTPTTISAGPNRMEIATFYVGETVNNASNKISVIIRGKYYGKEGYYRLDMIKAESENEVDLLKRNYRYVFVLQNVNYEGRGRNEEMSGESDNESFQATVMTLTAAESDILDITTDDRYFLGVNSSTLQLTDNGNICFTKLKVLTNNTTDGWVIADYPATGVTFMPGIEGGRGARAVNTVWIYIDKARITEQFNFYVKTGKIRKTITVRLP